ncbi:class I SAM-dependent methyltransferase [Clostridium bowmanii]|uniref:class I SAM-dependent methyltransferase n=1 Tax=Clostridium bowmanii TaxID=132925 RepID=UPI001C0AFC8D|nr:class I SAM-dependent methyltransferase [Clostridium bowmanii]MBU3191857.1 class I SAM-dependent methyltransferase [Clostridium bowmanii]MCA1076153.1 class I SAM-dependent methyltransferase [Clostridium bowmanii]
MTIENQREYFNNTCEKWKEIPEEKGVIINKAINLLGISEGQSVLDVASGTGVLYTVLKNMRLSNYVALDISENMLKELELLYPEVKTICDDFDKDMDLEEKFDYILIFNSIPHFENLNIVFSNAKKHLKIGGTFAIVHTKTRKELKEHHKRIGYTLGREAIPNDDTLCTLIKKYEFRELIVRDYDFFYFSCKR